MKEINMFLISGIVFGLGIFVAFFVWLVRRSTQTQQQEMQKWLKQDATYEFAERKRQWMLMAAMTNLSQTEAESLFREKVILQGIDIFVKLDSWLSLGSVRTMAAQSSVSHDKTK